MIQALAKHIKQLVALPDELLLTTIRKFENLCDSCGCHNEWELASYLAEHLAQQESARAQQESGLVLFFRALIQSLGVKVFRGFNRNSFNLLKQMAAHLFYLTFDYLNSDVRMLE
jgi:hypothetical protein